MYAICMSDDRIAFKLKMFYNRDNFPMAKVQNGLLDNHETRLHWAPNQRAKYFYADCDDEGNNILEADILEICEWFLSF